MCFYIYIYKLSLSLCQVVSAVEGGEKLASGEYVHFGRGEEQSDGLDASLSVTVCAVRVVACPRFVAEVLHPTPYTPHPTPYTLHPTPFTIHPTPFTIHPTPHTLHPTPFTLHPTPFTLHLTPFILQVMNYVRRSSAFRSNFAAASKLREVAVPFIVPEPPYGHTACLP